MELSLDRIGNARAVLIAGPTASGKSAAALALAEEARQARPAAPGSSTPIPCRSMMRCAC